MRSVRGGGHQLLKSVGLAVGLMEVSGGMVGVRAGEQESGVLSERGTWRGLEVVG
jgi:hypothetical protein